MVSVTNMRYACSFSPAGALQSTWSDQGHFFWIRHYQLVDHPTSYRHWHLLVQLAHCVLFIRGGGQAQIHLGHCALRRTALVPAPEDLHLCVWFPDNTEVELLAWLWVVCCPNPCLRPLANGLACQLQFHWTYKANTGHVSVCNVHESDSYPIFDATSRLEPPGGREVNLPWCRHSLAPEPSGFGTLNNLIVIFFYHGIFSFH